LGFSTGAKPANQAWLSSLPFASDFSLCAVPVFPAMVSPSTREPAAVLASGGTAAGSRVEGLTIAGKTGTAQSEKSDANGKELNHAWFAGFAPVENPKIVIVVMLEYVPFHGSQAARYGSALMARYLGVRAPIMINTGG
jgi:hypothetical protein